VKCGVKYLHIVLWTTCEVRENRRTDGRTNFWVVDVCTVTRVPQDSAEHSGKVCVLRRGVTPQPQRVYCVVRAVSSSVIYDVLRVEVGTDRVFGHADCFCTFLLQHSRFRLLPVDTGCLHNE
jgi:hypothetical protein